VAKGPLLPSLAREPRLDFRSYAKGIRSGEMSVRYKSGTAAGECAIVSPEANSAGKLRGDFEAMQKRRHQQPKPKREGNFWYLRIWQDFFACGVRTRKRQRVKLAPATMHQREVMKIADEVLRPINQ